MALVNRLSESQKSAEARKVIEQCRRDGGFYASTHNYHAQFWNRDLIYSQDVLLELGYAREVKAQLCEFMKHQAKDGRIPTSIHVSSSKGSRPVFHGWTADTEILFVIGVLKYDRFTSDSLHQQSAAQISRCVDFIERRLGGNGLIPGMDWRDAMPNYMGKFLLSNQMLLVDMYELLGRPDRAQQIREKVNELFYSTELGFYADSISYKRGKAVRDLHFDSLGNSMVLLNHTAGEGEAKGVLSALENARTQFGYPNITPAYRLNKARDIFLSIDGIKAFVRNGAFRRNQPNTYQNSAIWPFVESWVIGALRSQGAGERADLAASLVLARRGINEVYSPINGEPLESEGQLWTAASILSVARA